MTLWERFKKLVLIEQAVFGAFWLLSAIVVAHIEWPGLPFLWEKYFWIATAFFGARVAGMSFNRVSDRKIDAQNPRTKGRLIPRGLVSIAFVKFVAFLGLLLLMLSCFMIGKIISSALPLMIFFICVYAYTKRWTFCCHFVLGIVCGFAPFFAYLATSGKYTLIALLIALSQACIIASNDAIYAIQDLKFDRQYNVKSIPVTFGIGKTLVCSRLLQAISVLLLFSVGFFLRLSSIYHCGVAGIGALFYYLQLLLKTSKLSDVDPIFFKSNAYSGLILFTFSFGELIWRRFWLE